MGRVRFAPNSQALAMTEPSRKSAKVAWFRRLGPGLITGAADDDPGGIATHSQVGAQFGLNLMWTVALTYPLMTAIQSICARIGRVTGEGLAANMTRVLPRWLVSALVLLLFVANTVNIGADLAAMGAAAELVLGWGETFFAILFAAGSLVLQVFVPYHRYVHVLKWLTLSLLAYVGVVFTVAIDWGAVARGVLWPEVRWSRDVLIVIVAVFGTTISPYLFFWQSAEEVEDEILAGDGSLLDHPADAPAELDRIAWDTCIGMGFSSLVSFFIVLTTAVTLHAAGVTDIATSAEAAQALRPIAGEFAFLLFSLGIVGTGLLALPVLAGSAAYAIGELRGWRIGLEQKPENAKAFYGVLALAFGLGLLMLFLPIDPIKALFWSAVLNGVIAVPLMVATMIVVSSRQHLGPFVAPLGLKIVGWAATAVMAAAALAILVLS
ncbi:MAG: divalent metal cation transporter [Alphaproteobacteria bacterium]|nr:divalent metal cation transporter [Alphaproteobacteria bacterium]